jgi:hypothetical protein
MDGWLELYQKDLDAHRAGVVFFSAASITGNQTRSNTT